MCRLDPEAHSEDSPTAFELATVNGHVKTFELLTAKLHIDSNSEWFQLAQVCMVTLFFTVGFRQTVWNSMKHFKNFYRPRERISRVALSFLLQKLGSVFYSFILTAVGLGGVWVQVS